MKRTKPKWPYNTEISFTPPSREVHTVFLHCSASDKPEHDDISVIRRWHLARGWVDAGYHYFITREGHIQEGRPLPKTPAAQGGHNTGTIAICCHGKDRQLFSTAQMDSVYALCMAIRLSYATEKETTIRFRGHKEVANKACPVYDYKTLLRLDENGFMEGVPATTTTDPLSGEQLSRVEQYQLVQEEAAGVFSRKNADYGDSFATYGAIGVLVRMQDKIQRAISVSKNSITLVSEETLRDTLIDLHNYSAMAVMLLDEDNLELGSSTASATTFTR